MKPLIVAVKIFFLMTLITGIIYPATVTLYSSLITREQSAGSFVSRGDTIIGSELIAQKFQDSKYFWNRPSAIDYNPTSSGASNHGPTSNDLKNQIEERRKVLLLSDENASQNKTTVPQDLLFASGSGLDPHISPEAAIYQAARVAKSRGLDIGIVRKLVNELTEAPQYGIFGEPRINTLRLNLALDNLNQEVINK